MAITYLCGYICVVETQIFTGIGFRCIKVLFCHSPRDRTFFCCQKKLCSFICVIIFILSLLLFPGYSQDSSPLYCHSLLLFRESAGNCTGVCCDLRQLAAAAWSWLGFFVSVITGEESEPQEWKWMKLNFHNFQIYIALKKNLSVFNGKKL